MISIPYLICSILSFVPAIVCHEACHGFAAYKLGDPTAKRAGRLSFNPLKHIDPFGTVIMPLLLMAMNMPVFGYAKPDSACGNASSLQKHAPVAEACFWSEDARRQRRWKTFSRRSCRASPAFSAEQAFRRGTGSARPGAHGTLRA